MRNRLLCGILSLAIIFSLSACGSSGNVSASTEISHAEIVPLATDKAETAEAVFSDIPANASYAEAVTWCQEQGLMDSVGGGRFDPEGTLTRSMMATVLYRAAGEPAVRGTPVFTDTQAGTWYSNAVVWANEKGILLGYGNNVFGINDPVSVEQLAVIMGCYSHHS